MKTRPSPEEEQQRLFWAVCGFLRAAAETAPVALLLDDLHWADGSSLDLLLHLARHTRLDRVLILATYRDVEVNRRHPLEHALRSLGRERIVDEVPVRRLAEDGTAELIRTTMGVDEVGAEFVDLIYGHTEGNPFFIQEVLRALVERGDVYRDEGGWHRHAIQQIEIPKSVRSAVGERVSRLPDMAQEVLGEASVLGPFFAFEELLAMARRSEDEVEPVLEEAAQAGLIRETPSGYAFNHALTQGTLYAELPSRRRRRLHLAAAEALEQLPDAEREQRAAALARHFLESDDVRRALPYALLAGDRAEAMFAHREAECQYRIALDVARDLEDETCEAEALEKLGALLKIVGRYAEALEVLERAVTVFARLGDAEGERRVVAQIGRVHATRGTSLEGLDRLLPVLTAAEEAAARSQGLAELYAAVGQLSFRLNRFEESRDAAARAGQLARELGNDRILVEAEVRRGSAIMEMGERDDGRRILEGIVHLAKDTGELLELARALNNLSGVNEEQGDLLGARTYREQALEVARRLNDPASVAFALTTLSRVLTDIGDWPAARAALEESRELVLGMGTSWFASYPTLGLACLSLLEDRADEGLRYLDEVRPLLDHEADPEHTHFVGLLLAQWEIFDGRPDDAVRRLEPLLPLQATAAYHFKGVGALYALACAVSGTPAHLERAEEFVGERLDDPPETQYTYQDGYTLAAASLLAIRRRRWDEARRLLEISLALARAAGAAHGEGRILHLFALMHAARGERDEAEARQREALAIFERIGARLDARAAIRQFQMMPDKSG